MKSLFEGIMEDIGSYVEWTKTGRVSDLGGILRTVGFMVAISLILATLITPIITALLGQ